MNIWEILNIDETTDIKTIRHAYSIMSKQCHLESEPEKFQQLYQAYHKALEFAKNNKHGETDFSAYGSHMQSDALSEKENGHEKENSVQEQDMPAPSIYDNLEDMQKLQSETSSDGEEEQQETPYSTLFGDQLYINTSTVVKDGLTAFQEYFEQKGKKDWKEFVTRPEFLRAQFDERFVRQIVDFLRKQTLYPVNALPYDMVKELYFCYYPYMNEQTDPFFEDGFTELFRMLFQNDNIGRIENLHQDFAVINEVVKYNVYYKLYKVIREKGARQNLSEWKVYIADAAREMFVKDGITSFRDPHIFKLLAFLIEEAPVFSDEIYNLLIKELRLSQAEGTSQQKIAEPLCQAISAKGISIQNNRQQQVDEIAERRQLMEEINKLYFQNLTDDDRPMLREFFGSGIYSKYKLDEEFMEYRFVVFALQHDHFPKVFIEEYLAFYDKLYEQTGSKVGKQLYNMFSSFLKADASEEEEYEEITDNKKEWLLKYFFEEGFTRVWKSSSKGAMRVVYRGILTDQLTALAEQHNYEWDLWDDGHLLALKDGENYVFSYDKIKEKATLTMTEYYSLLEEMMDLYMKKYFLVSSEKNTLMELKERAGRVL